MQTISDTSYELNYEKGGVAGSLISDTVCLSLNGESSASSLFSHCVEQMPFLGVVKSTELDGLFTNGVLGLAPGEEREFESSGMSNNLIENMFEKGLIKEKIFSFYLGESSDFRNPSTFTLDGYDLDRFAPNSTLSWNYLTDANSWEVKLDNAFLGDSQITLSANRALIDTGTSFLAMPDEEFNSLLYLMQKE